MMLISPRSRGTEVKAPAKKPISSVRVGHVYLDVRQRRLHLLNQATRELHNDGVPFTASDLSQSPLQTPKGAAVTVADIPLLVAWREEQPVEAEFVLPRENGTVWHVAWTATPLRDTRGDLLGIVGAVICGPPGPDWRKLAELAHDLRTPLQSLRLLCDLLDRLPQNDAELATIVASMRCTAERAVQLALELLDCCSEPAQRGDRESSKWFALEPFLQSLAAEQAAAAQSKGLALITDFQAAQGWEVDTDRSRLGRVLANLLVNAVRYTSMGRVEFTASWRQEGDLRRLALGVVDTGPGISQEEQESIFEPFERGRAGKEGDTGKNEPDTGGSGLGLAVVDRLVQELGLEIEVYSEHGRGSAFHLLVPESLLRPAQG